MKSESLEQIKTVDDKNNHCLIPTLLGRNSFYWGDSSLAME